MGDVHIDTKKNRIHILITDTTREELAGTVRQIEEAALALRPYFTCLTDFRTAGTLLVENRDLLERGQRALAEVGIGKAVRLITEDQRQSLHFQHLDVVGVGYTVEFVTSLKEAERILNAYKREADQIGKRMRNGGSMFRIFDPQVPMGETELFLDFGKAVKTLRQIRRGGHPRAIVVDVGCEVANGVL